MLMRKIDHARERSILKTKTHTRWVGVRRNAYNGIHQLVEHTPVRNNQVTSGRSLQQSLQCLTCAQVQSPIPLSHTPQPPRRGHKVLYREAVAFFELPRQ